MIMALRADTSQGSICQCVSAIKPAFDEASTAHIVGI
jgi:hypothetical protein